MTRRVCLLLLCILSPLSFSAAVAADYYVNAENGSDTNSGLEPPDAWETITYALSAAICSPDDPATIHIAAGTYSASTNGEVFPLEMRSFVSLQGEDPETTILDAEGQAYHVICCSQVVKVELGGMTVSRGNADRSYGGQPSQGGGVHCSASTDIVLTNCVIKDNRANEGGGIYCENSSLEIRATSIRNNKTMPNLYGEGWGGGVCCRYSSLDLNDSQLSQNTSYFGGGIFVGDANTYFERCEILENAGMGDSTGLSWGAGIGAYSAAAEFVSCSISGNSAYSGSGLYCGSGSQLDMSECRIEGNEAQPNDAGNSVGGGLSLKGSAAMIRECSFGQNSANRGGAIDCSDSTMEIEDTRISGNIAPHNPQDARDTSWGGGLCVHGSTITVSRGLISENSANIGAGIHISGGDACKVLDCEIASNHATPGLYGNSWGGGVDLRKSSLLIDGCAIHDNSANKGGGIDCFDASPTVNDCHVFSNSAWRGAGVRFERCSGAVIAGCEIEQNVAVPDEWGWCTGGGVNAEDTYSVDVSSCRVIRNSAWEGAGIAFCESSGEIANCVVADNLSTPDKDGSSYGGGIYLRNGRPSVRNCLIFGNSAVTGGGLQIGSVSPSVNSCTIWGNTAQSGGGLSCSREDSGSISDMIIWANSDSVHLGETASVRIEHSCIEGGYDGEGNISDDPLFVTGPFGDYYLSCEAAGQTENSPCIDAGSDAAENLGLGQLTTRTDNEADAGVVDMGYHYPIYLGGPTIECSLNASSFRPGDYLVGSLKVANDGPDIEVDVYVAFVLPDGAIFCITPHGGLTNEILPWIEYMLLPEDYSFGPAPMFEAIVPGGIPPGGYLFAAAFSAPGQFELIVQPGVFAFTVGD